MYNLFIFFFAGQCSTCHYIIICLSIYPSPAHELLDDFQIFVIILYTCILTIKYI